MIHVSQPSVGERSGLSQGDVVIDPISRVALARSGGSIREARLLTSHPRVSVIIPCYNYGHFLAACVASALDHEGVDIEVIIVDDASPDGSGEVAEQIAASDDRVSVIRHEKNKRHLATYNDGFAAASGDYLVQLSADDLLPRNSLTRALALLESVPSVGFVYGRTVPFHGTPPPPKSNVHNWLTWSGANWIAERCRSGYNCIATTEVVWRKSVIDEVGPYRLDLPHSGDLELWMRFATVADVGFVAGPDQAFYRLHESNMHNEMFGSGTMDGQLIDLEERWKAFAAFFEAPPRRVGSFDALERTARRTLAREALDRISYSYARGLRQFPEAKFQEFAYALDPSVTGTASQRALNRRRRFGMKSMPLNPLWAPRWAKDRLSGPTIAWRRGRVGI
jgi:glycosyltransferase involved in cell wall biosynthesis